MKKRAAAIMGRILLTAFLVWLAGASLMAALLAQAPFVPSAEAQSSTGMEIPYPSYPGAGESGVKKPLAPEGPTTEGQWVPGNHFSISLGCLKKWICDCSKVKAPRGARIERTPTESIAGVCEAGARGSCTVCGAGPPPKKCECKTRSR